MGTKIEWCNAFEGRKGETWNPAVGCTPVSEGCENCYAERLSKRVYHAAEEPFRPRAKEHKLEEPLGWRKRRFVFVCSMGDLFHPMVSDRHIEAVMGTIGHRKCRNHIFAVLTKRAGRMREFMCDHYQLHGGPPPENLWLGVTAENQRCAEERVPDLLKTPAAVRFVSCEPLLGEVTLRALKEHGTSRMDALEGIWYETAKDVPALDWVLCGGESGPGARPMHPRWARALRDQCTAAGVPFLFKQWGRWAPRENVEGGLNAGMGDPGFGKYVDRYGPPVDNECFEEGVMGAGGQHMVKVGKKQAGRELDGETHDEVPDITLQGRAWS